MDTKNLEFLQDGLKYLGFDPKLGLELARNMQSEVPSFTLLAEAKHFKDSMEAVLHFRKSENSNMYFFNKYEATLSKEDGSNRQQTFYINRNAGITFKEAYNLLSGRAVNKDLVNKEGERYNAWVQLDFSRKDKHDNNSVKQYTTNYGYDLMEVLSKHGIKELSDPEQKERLVRSLTKGNLQSVTFQKDGSEQRMYIEANPQFKSVNIFDDQLKKVYQENATKKEMKQAETTQGTQSPQQQNNHTGNRQKGTRI